MPEAQLKETPKKCILHLQKTRRWQNTTLLIILCHKQDLLCSSNPSFLDYFLNALHRVWESKLFFSCPVRMWLAPTVCSALQWHLQRYCDANKAVHWITYPESRISNIAVFKRLRIMWMPMLAGPVDHSSLQRPSIPACVVHFLSPYWNT